MNVVYSYLGMEIHFTDNGASIVSNTGKQTQFDCNGVLINSEVKENFMQYFDFMGSEERKLTSEWCKRQKAESNEQQVFLKLVKDACNKISKDYYIANIEPSMDKNGKIYYKEGDKVVRGLLPSQWLKKAAEFAPDYGSELATIYQYVLWLAYRVAKGFWTLKYLCDDFPKLFSLNWAHKFDVSGAKVIGGARDGIGNTGKLLRDAKNRIAYHNINYYINGEAYSINDISYIFGPVYASSIYTGVITLNKLHSISN